MGNKKKERKEVKSTLGGNTPRSAALGGRTTFTEYKCPICSETDAYYYIVDAAGSRGNSWLCGICGSRNSPYLSDLPFGCLATGIKKGV
jgi:hypothetical protein